MSQVQTAAARPVDDAVLPAREEKGPIEHVKVMPSFDYRRMMLEVVQKRGKSYWAQVREMYELKFGAGRIAPVEYYHYGLYDDSMSMEQKRTFVGTNLRAMINETVLNRDFFGIGKDKITFYAWAKGLGLPAPQVRALYHPNRFLAEATPLHDLDALAFFLRGSDAYPFFAKPAHLTASVGVASAERYHSGEDTIELSDGRRFPVTRFADEIRRYFKAGYIFQERLRPHPAVAALAGDRVSTIRVMVLNDGGPQIIRTSWRVPAGENVADTLWRGNMLAALDIETGAVRRVVQGRGVDQRLTETHPDTGAQLVGVELPMWSELRVLALGAAAAVPGLTLTGWDIAITNRGPVLIELEPDGGDPAVTQLASGEGLLNGPYGAFVERHREALKRKPKAAR